MCLSSDFCDGEGFGVDHLQYHHTARTGQPGDQVQSVWVYKRQILIDKSDLLL